MQIIFDFICFIFLLVSNAFYNYLQEIHPKIVKSTLWSPENNQIIHLAS